MADVIYPYLSTPVDRSTSPVYDDGMTVRTTLDGGVHKRRLHGYQYVELTLMHRLVDSATAEQHRTFYYLHAYHLVSFINPVDGVMYVGELMAAPEIDADGDSEHLFSVKQKVRGKAV